MLLEVVLALTLFVAAATVITGGLNASVREVERLRLNLHASDLAVSLMTEMQMGQRPVESAGPNPFEEPYDNWIWQVISAPAKDTPGSTAPLVAVEVIVRHQTEPIVRRLTQYLPTPSEDGPEAAAAPDLPTDATRSPANEE